MRNRLKLASVVLVMLALGCSRKLPAGPSNGFADGIVVYEDADFLGRSAHITSDIPDLRNYEGPCEHTSQGSSPPATTTYTHDWNDCISSVRVAAGWSATLYRDDFYRDDSIEIVEDMPNLQLAPHDCPSQGLNDCVTSIQVRRR